MSRIFLILAGNTTVTLPSCEQACTCRTVALQEMITVFRQTCLPTDNYFPPTKYIMFNLMKPDPLESCMYHQCTACNDYAWGPQPREQWESHKHDKCGTAGCQGTRFWDGRGAKLEPHKVNFFSVLLSNVVYVTMRIRQRHFDTQSTTQTDQTIECKGYSTRGALMPI